MVQLVSWNPPPHKLVRDIHLSFLKADGAYDIHQQLNLSGEPLIPDLRESFELRPPMDLVTYQNNTLKGLACEAEYSDYWNSTAAEDGQSPTILPFFFPCMSTVV
jgi:amidase